MFALFMLIILSVSILPFYSLSFFGVWMGTFNIFGLSIEHEWFGFGFLLVGFSFVLLAYKKLKYHYFSILMIGLILFISDNFISSFAENPLGSFVSLILGIVFGVLISILIL